MPHQYYSILNIFANYLVHYWLRHFLLHVADTPTMFPFKLDVTGLCVIDQ